MYYQEQDVIKFNDSLGSKRRTSKECAMRYYDQAKEQSQEKAISNCVPLERENAAEVGDC